MKRNGKSKSSAILVILILLLAVGAYFYFHKTTPITTPTTGTDTGWDLHLYDANGNEIPIPDNFAIGSKLQSRNGAFSIWTTETPITCTTDANCPGTHPPVVCWSGSCVIKGAVTMSLGFSVTSSSSTITYNSLNVQSVTPTAWNTALVKTARTLAPLATTQFTSAIFAIPTSWENTIVPFSVTVQGTNNYNELIETQTKSISYKFYPDPTGGFQITISNPFG